MDLELALAVAGALKRPHADRRAVPARRRSASASFYGPPSGRHGRLVYYPARPGLRTRPNKQPCLDVECAAAAVAGQRSASRPQACRSRRSAAPTALGLWPTSAPRSDPRMRRDRTFPSGLTWCSRRNHPEGLETPPSQHEPGSIAWGHARSTSNAAMLLSSLLNSTPIKWIGWRKPRYLSA